MDTLHNGLYKYNIFLRPKGIESLVNPVIEHVKQRNISHDLPGLGHHVTLFGFYSAAHEDSLVYLAQKEEYAEKILLHELDVFNNHLVFKLYPQNSLIQKQKNLLSAFKNFINFKNGTPEDKGAFDKKFVEKYNYSLNYIPHMTVCEGNFSAIRGIAKSAGKAISKVYQREFEVEYCLSQKTIHGWKCLYKK